FFQAEDGIRDPLVTGVQTCALPILRYWLERASARRLIDAHDSAEMIAALTSATQLLNRLIAYRRSAIAANGHRGRVREDAPTYEIGRASCRERRESYVGDA